jgi:predicted metal-dependent hydrolase
MDREAHRAFVELYGREPDTRLTIRYHGNFKGFNASVRKHKDTMEFALSRAFKDVEPEVRLGVMQLLLNRLHRTKIKSDHIDFYNTFLKKMSDYAPVTRTDPELEASFQRMNARYFHGLMTQPNLVWGNDSVQLLGTYTYATDTIMISRSLAHAPQEVLDSVVYHEMLHKKHKFNCTSGRTHSHTAAFRREEALFEPKDVEERLHRWLRSYRRHRAYAPRDNLHRESERNIVQRVLDWF